MVPFNALKQSSKTETTAREKKKTLHPLKHFLLERREEKKTKNKLLVNIEIY